MRKERGLRPLLRPFKPSEHVDINKKRRKLIELHRRHPFLGGFRRFSSISVAFGAMSWALTAAMALIPDVDELEDVLVLGPGARFELADVRKPWKTWQNHGF